jgi:hypothetical protein
MPSSCGMFVYSDLTSIVHRIEPASTVVFSICWMNAVVSRSRFGISFSVSFSRWSVNSLMRDVGPSQLDTIGRPGGGILPLCILGLM